MKNQHRSKNREEFFKNLPHKKGIIIQKKSVYVLLLLLILFAFSFALTYYDLFPENLQISEGSIAEDNIIAKRAVTYVDTEKTEELRAKIAESVPPIYRFEIEVQQRIFTDLNKFFSDIIAVLNSEGTIEEKKTDLGNILEGDTYVNLLLNENIESLNKLKEYVDSLVSKLMVTGIRSDELSQAIKNGSDEIKKSEFTDEEKSFLIHVLGRFLQPNMVYDSVATEAAKEEAKRSVPPVRITIQQGSVVLRKGDKITADHIKALNALGLIRSKANLRLVFNVLFILLFALGISFFALIRAYAEKKNLLKKILEFSIIFAISFSISFFTKNISLFLIAIPLFAMVVSEFMDITTSLVLTLCFSLTLMLPVSVNSITLLSMLISTVVYLYAFKRSSQILSFIYSGTAGGILFGLSTFFIEMSSQEIISVSISNSLISFLNFFASTIIAIGFVYLIEHLFNEVTIMRLFELSDAKSPPLQELMVKAPGTYQHSMMVASLAGAAAEAIGANELLTKVGAYYHDIGKMVHPYYFTENQQMIPNIHNQLSPNLSKTVIINHVKEGIEIARIYKLPDEIVDFIATHHGTTAVSYFYHKAKEMDPDTNKDEFRYPGPLPTTKETAILMLADAIEATSHSLESLEYGKIEYLVNSIVSERVEDRQLDESAITFLELKKLKESFVKNLISMYHRREKYPGEKES